jgi:hypothetical protein
MLHGRFFACGTGVLPRCFFCFQLFAKPTTPNFPLETLDKFPHVTFYKKCYMPDREKGLRRNENPNQETKRGEIMKKRRRKWLRALLCTLGVVVIAAAAVALWQRENIGAFIASRRYTGAQLEERLAEQEQNAGKILEKLPEVSIRPLTEDEKEKIRKGEVSEEEAIDLMLGKNEKPANAAPSTPQEAGNSAENAEPPEKAEPPPEDERQKRAAELVAKIYVLRETMTGQIEGLIGDAKKDYGALPEAERTSSKKQEIALLYMGKVTALEKTCDAQMKDVVGELETILKETGGDTSAAEEIMRSYKEEKNLKKSYFLSQYS